MFVTFEREEPVELQDGIRQVTAEEDEALIALLDDALVFSSEASEFAALEPGTVLLSVHGEGYARRVVEVMADDSAPITLKTVNVPLSEVIREGTLIYNEPITNGDVLKVEPTTGIRHVVAPAISPSIRFDVDLTLFEDGPSKATLKGTVDLEIRPDVALNYVPFIGAEEFRAIVSVKARSSLTLSMSGDIEALSVERVLPLPQFRVVHPLPGPLPIPVTHVVSTQIKVTTTGKVSISGFSEATGTGGGYWLETTGWTRVGDFESVGDIGPFDPTGQGPISAESDVMVGPLYGARVLGLVGPEIFIGPYLKMKVNYDHMSDCAAWSARAGGRAKFKLGSTKIPSIDWQLPGVSYTLFDVSFKVAGDETGNCVDKEAPSTPGEPSVFGPIRPNSLELVWAESEDNSAVAMYEIYRDDRKIGETVASEYIDNSIRSYTDHCYQVVAVDMHGNKSNRSTALCVYTEPDADDEPPEDPRNLTVVGVSRNSLSLDWDDAIDDSTLGVSYLVYVDEAAGTSWKVRTDASEVTVSGLKPGTQYCFEVAARDAAGNASFFSNFVCGTTSASGSYGTSYMVVACEDNSGPEIQATIDLEDDLSEIGYGTSDGTPFMWMLSGTFDDATRELSGQFDWFFAGSNCRRTDRFTVNLDSEGSGSAELVQVSSCDGCVATIEFSPEPSNWPLIGTYDIQRIGGGAVGYGQIVQVVVSPCAETPHHYDVDFVSASGVRYDPRWVELRSEGYSYAGQPCMIDPTRMIGKLRFSRSVTFSPYSLDFTHAWQLQFTEDGGIDGLYWEHYVEAYSGGAVEYEFEGQRR